MARLAPGLISQKELTKGASAQHLAYIAYGNLSRELINLKVNFMQKTERSDRGYHGKEGKFDNK